MEELNKELKLADDLFDTDRLEEAIEFLGTLNQSHVRVLWRIARAKYQLAKNEPIKRRKLDLLESGFEYAKKSLECDENNAQAHLFYACLLDAVSEAHGLRERAIGLTDVKKHIVRSIELDQSDALCRHGLGVLMYQLADLAWYKRKILEAVFTKPPDGSFEEALKHFLIAEEVEPDFYSVNKLMIAKSYLALKDYANARIYLLKAASVAIKNDDDVECVKEAKQLLEKHK